MAQATVNKSVKPAVGIDAVFTEGLESVELTLTPQEAETLVFLFRYVGGCPQESRRRYVAEVGAALEAAGVRAPAYIEQACHDMGFVRTRGFNDSIYFDTVSE